MSTPNGKIELVITDADGVIVDVKSANYNTWWIILVAGHDLAQDVVEDLLTRYDPMTMSVECFASFLVSVGRDCDIDCFDQETLVRYWKEYYASHYLDQPFVPGAIEALEELKKLNPNLKIAIASNTPSKLLLPKLEPVKGLFDAMAVADQGPWPEKPEPDMLHHLLSTLQIEPKRAIMVGDGPSDTGAAGIAGTGIIVVKGGWPGVANFYQKCIDEGITVLESLAYLPGHLKAFA